MDITKVLSSNLRRIRTEKGLTQQALADEVKVNVQTIRDIEAGRRNPSFPILETIGKALTTHPSEFLKGKQKKAEIVEISIVEAIRRFQSIPPDIYERAVKLGPSHVSWEEVRVVLDQGIKDDQNSPSGGAGALA